MTSPLLVSSKQLPRQSSIKDTHTTDAFKARAGEPMPSARPPSEPPVTSTRRAKPSHFLPIASLLNPHTGLKRRRHGLDVDGPNTAALSSKKRRLRLDLVTSPLSRPYAQPASHIHVRTDSKAAACPSAKKDANVSAQPRLPHLPATSFLRLSVVNRIRERMELRPPPIFKLSRADLGLDAAPKASWFRSRPRYQSGGRMLGPAPSAPAAGRRLVAKRCSTREMPAHSPEKTLPEMRSQPCPPPTDLKLAAIDTITSLLSDALPPASDDARLFMSTDDDFGQDSFTLSDHRGEALRYAPEESRELNCDYGMLFGKARSLCAGSQDERPRAAVGPREVSWVER